jgi:hypothetical protein
VSNVSRKTRTGSAVAPAPPSGADAPAKPTGVSGTRLATWWAQVPAASFEQHGRSTMETLDDEWQAVPEMQVEATRVSEQSDLMVQIADGYLERLGGRRAVPSVAVPRGELTKLTLDHGGGFVLSLIDGIASVQDILDVSPMPEHEVLDVLDRLRERGLIRVRPRPVRS